MQMSIQGIFRIEQWDFERASILTGLPEAYMTKLMKRKSEHRYKKGEVIFREGTYPAGVFLIAEGKVKKYKAVGDGSEQIIYIANSGELIGYHTILSGDPYPYSAASIEDSVIASIPKEDFLKVLERSVLLMRRLLKTLSHDFSVLTNSLTIDRHAREI
jgi:CRP-like cAMP-binding protein